MGSEVSTIQSLKAVDAWIDVINANINGGVRTAFKTSRLSFSGSNTNVVSSGNTAALPLQFPEPSLVTANTSLDISQGAIVASTEDTHAAIQGQGYFLVADASGKIMLTRDGEFHRDATGALVTNDGLMVVDTALAINLDPTLFQFVQPALTVNAVNSGTAGWQRAAASWFPYIPGTTFDEGGGYHTMTVFSKRTYFVQNPALASSLTLASDDAGWLMINGHLLTAADKIAGAGPPSWSGTPTTYNVAPYLQAGANTIVAMVSENFGGQGVSVTGNVGEQTVVNDTRWASQVVRPNYDPSPPSTTEIQQAFQPMTTDLVLTKGPIDGNSLQFTRYGATVWDWLNPPAVIPIDLPGANGIGSVLGKSLEASNSSMTQSVPELSLAQKLFSALTKVLQTKQTNVDGVLNLVR